MNGPLHFLNDAIPRLPYVRLLNLLFLKRRVSKSFSEQETVKARAMPSANVFSSIVVCAVIIDWQFLSKPLKLIADC